MRGGGVEAGAGERPEQLNNVYVPTAARGYKATKNAALT